MAGDLLAVSQSCKYSYPLPTLSSIHPSRLTFLLRHSLITACEGGLFLLVGTEQEASAKSSLLSIINPIIVKVPYFVILKILQHRVENM